MRRDFLKGYVLSLISEGALRGASSPSAMGKKVASMFAKDLPAVLTDMAQTAFEQSGHRIGAAVMSRLADVVKDVDKRGVKAVWADVQAQYKRGMDVNAGRRG